MPDLSAAIDDIYAAFAFVRKPQPLVVCPCCIDESQVQRLLSKPLRDVAPADMSAYASAAGRSPDQFAYFLPRHLEIAASHDGWSPDPEVIGCRIAESNLETWSQQQKDAVESLFRLVVHKSLAPEQRQCIDAWLCCIAHAGFNVSSYLSAVQNCADAVLEYFNDNPRVTEGRLGNAYWELPCQGHDDIVDWFHSKPVRKILYDAYHLSW